jgi:cellobiose phosphorylase
MIAEARAGNGDGALDYYLRINPSVREAISEVHRCEPYVYSQMISGKDAPIQGEAKNSWLSGTAAWNFVAITQWILGIRAEHDGLRIDPVVPADWGDFKATRRFRGASYSITVRKSKGSTGRVTRLTVDGFKIAGNLVPLPTRPGGSFDVEAFVE